MLDVNVALRSRVAATVENLRYSKGDIAILSQMLEDRRDNEILPVLYQAGCKQVVPLGLARIPEGPVLVETEDAEWVIQRIDQDETAMSGQLLAHMPDVNRRELFQIAQVMDFPALAIAHELKPGSIAQIRQNGKIPIEWIAPDTRNELEVVGDFLAKHRPTVEAKAREWAPVAGKVVLYGLLGVGFVALVAASGAVLVAGFAVAAAMNDPIILGFDTPYGVNDPGSVGYVYMLSKWQWKTRQQ